MEEGLKPIYYYFNGNGINGNEGGGGGGMKLPIGFRFHPTDEELIVHYLKRKVYCFPLPVSVIPELDVFQTNPWDLPGDVREKRYFFCKRKRNVNKSCNRLITSTTTNATSGERGYWKAVGKEKQIVVVDHHHPAATGNPRGSSNQAVAVVGVKKSLVFYQLAAGKRPRGSIRRTSRTQWVMHEFRLILGSQTSPNSNSTLLQQQQQQQKFKMEMEDWVVCRIYQKKRKLPKNIGAARIIDHQLSVEKIRPSIMDIMMMREVSNEYSGPPQPSSSSSSSPCSSGITEVSSKGSDQEETTGPYY